MLGLSAVDPLASWQRALDEGIAQDKAKAEAEARQAMLDAFTVTQERLQSPPPWWTPPAAASTEPARRTRQVQLTRAMDTMRRALARTLKRQPSAREVWDAFAHHPDHRVARHRLHEKERDERHTHKGGDRKQYSSNAVRSHRTLTESEKDRFPCQHCRSDAV